jgi:hypothetical protein
MRRVARLLPLSVLLLPGCILAVHDHRDWDDDHDHSPKSSLEQRVSELEHRVHDLQECMENCTAGCCKGEGDEMHEKGEKAEHEMQPPKPSAPK